MEYNQEKKWSSLNDLRKLRYFVEVASTGNFGRASRSIGVEQTTLTHSIKALEKSLGSELLVRHGRGVTLTAAGSKLAERAKIIVDLTGRMLEQVTSPDLSNECMSLGLPPAISALIGPAILGQYRDKFPEVPVNLREEVSSVLEDMVMNQEIELAVLRNAPNLSVLRIIHILNEPLVLVVSPRSQLAVSLDSISLRELVKIPLILPGLRHSNRRLIMQAEAQCGISLRPKFAIDSLPLTKEMVRQDFGCAILTHQAVQDEVSRGTLHVRPIGRPELLSTLSIVGHHETYQARVAELAAILRTTMVDLVHSGVWKRAQVVKTNLNSDGRMPTPEA